MLLSVSYEHGYIRRRFLGIRLPKTKTALLPLENAYNAADSFDLREIDHDIARFADNVRSDNAQAFHVPSGETQRVAFLATMFLDSGGHTECVKTLVGILSDIYETGVFLVEKNKSFQSAPVKMQAIAQKAKIMGLDGFRGDFAKSLIALYNQIVDYNPKVLFLFYHMDDIMCAALCSLLQKHTTIKLLYFNHGSHFKALGFSFCDLVLEGMPVTHYVTCRFRHIAKGRVMGLVAPKKEDVVYFSEQEKQKKRQELGIADGAYFTLTGGGGYKFFEDTSSEYFVLIKQVLQEEPKLRHVVVSRFSSKQKAIIESVFADAREARARLVLTELTPHFDLLLQACDLFIDTFPVSSALTQIDLMRNKRPSVVKINRKNPLLSFHEYLPADYPYMFDSPESMRAGILTLLHDPEKRILMAERLYRHYLENYEGSAVCKKYQEIIDSSLELSSFHQAPPPLSSYNFAEAQL